MAKKIKVIRELKSKIKEVKEIRDQNESELEEELQETPIATFNSETAMPDLREESHVSEQAPVQTDISPPQPQEEERPITYEPPRREDSERQYVATTMAPAETAQHFDELQPRPSRQINEPFRERFSDSPSTLHQHQIGQEQEKEQDRRYVDQTTAEQRESARRRRL